jgi:hypothetical protein
MELRMTRDRDNTDRALRLLRWYPPSWRDRYGEEFVDHLEQEFKERPSNLGRSVNVMRKGVVARLGDVGLADSVAAPGAQSRAALGTSVALAALMVVVMVDFWSRAMLVWSGRTYHPIPVSATTGTLTVAVALVLVVLTVTLIVVATCVVRQILRGRARPLVVPSSIAVVSGAFLLYRAYFPEVSIPVYPWRSRYSRNEFVPSRSTHCQFCASYVDDDTAVGRFLESRTLTSLDDPKGVR